MKSFAKCSFIRMCVKFAPYSIGNKIDFGDMADHFNDLMSTSQFLTKMWA